MAKLTKARIDVAKYAGKTYTGKDGRVRHGDCILWDGGNGGMRGLGLRIHPSGRKTFILKYRTRNQRRRQLVIGEFGTLTLVQARRRARRKLVKISDGEDPLADRRKAARAEAVAQLAERYLVRHAEPKKRPKSVEEDRRMLRLHVIPRLGHRKVEDVDRRDIADLHHAMRATPYAANRVLSLLSKMFSLAEKWGIRADGSNPCRHVERFREERRERYLSAEELGSLAEALATVEREGKIGPHAVAAVRLLLLTGCRLREILGLRWEDVDLRARLLRLRSSKTGPKLVYLSAPAREVLSNIPRTEGFLYVVEGRNPSAPRADLTKPWRRIRILAQLEDVRIHDLRHTHAAVGAGLGLSLPMLGRLLGHTQPVTTARYAHLAVDPMHEAADRIGAELAAAMSGGEKASVAQLVRRRA
ncbi:MAG: tyrosine-type recombinase/integrase [bacterium]|nr:tyrosine-type recombinase/integrase [bacterium]